MVRKNKYVCFVAVYGTPINCVSIFTLRVFCTCRYGFEKRPKLDLVAKPRLGHREVTLSRVTHWIEKKLCELVNVSSLVCTLACQKVETTFAFNGAP